MALKPYGAEGEDTETPPTEQPPPPPDDSGTDTGGGTNSTTGDTSIGTAEHKFAGLGGEPELWKNGDEWYIVYYAPGPFDPPIATMWRVPDEETLKAFGHGEIPTPDKTVTDQDIIDTGSILFGTTNEIPEGDLDPWTGFKERMERAAKVQPWLTDPEVYALIGAAYIEDRDIQDWELQGTDWWQSRNAAQRAWAEKALADPETAAQTLGDNILTVQSMFSELGAVGNDPALIEFMAQQYTYGNWTQRQLADQVEAVTSGWTTVLPETQEFMEDNEIDAVHTEDQTEAVRAMFDRWLGPAFPPTDEQISQWATKLRNSPAAEEELTAMLRNQRQTLYPQYTDPNATYQDIASPWKSVVQQMWGRTADETAPMFQEILAANDLGTAQKVLRREGLKQGVDKVKQEAAMAMSAAGGGGSVRRAI